MIHYYITTNIWLNLEDFYNQGITPDRAKEIIESIHDPSHTASKLQCKPSGINENWIIEIQSNSEYLHECIVRVITLALTKELVGNSGKPSSVVNPERSEKTNSGKLSKRVGNLLTKGD